MKIEDLSQAKDGEQISYVSVIKQLKSKRFIELPDITKAKDQLDPMSHDVFNKVKRPDKKVRIDPDDPEFASTDKVINVTGGEQVGFRMEPVARIALSLQKLIVKRAVSFIFGREVELDANPNNEQEKAVMTAIKRILYDIKDKSFNRRLARHLFSSTEVAELWYPVEKDNTAYGFKSKVKLRCAIFSPLLGDALYPYFDESGDMVAFSREFTVSNDAGLSKSYFETYTDEFHYIWEQGSEGYSMVEGYPIANTLKKIPIVFGRQADTEWADVQILIERLEKLLSNFADTNDYHASPKIFVKGQITGFSKKGETGAILEGDENSEATYLSWQNAPEAVKLEIDTLLRMTHTLTQTPDISFDSVKGIGAVSGIALKLLFMDAHLKVADHQEVFDEYLQRRINILKAYVGKMNTSLEKAADSLIIEPVITPYIITDEAAEIKIWQDANGGNPVMSQKASFQKAAMTSDPEKDYEQYIEESNSRNTFSLFEPTQA